MQSLPLEWGVICSPWYSAASGSARHLVDWSLIVSELCRRFYLLSRPSKCDWDLKPCFHSAASLKFVYVCGRSACPLHGVMILNKQGLNNQVEPITELMEFQITPPFLLYRNGKGMPWVLTSHCVSQIQVVVWVCESDTGGFVNVRVRCRLLWKRVSLRQMVVEVWAGYWWWCLCTSLVCAGMWVGYRWCWLCAGNCTVFM